MPPLGKRHECPDSIALTEPSAWGRVRRFREGCRVGWPLTHSDEVQRRLDDSFLRFRSVRDTLSSWEARIRASQLHQCISNGTEPQETVIQAALDLIAMGQGPSDPAALSDKVSMVSQTPDVQTNATLPAQDSSSSINTTACAEVTANPLYRAVTPDNHSNPMARVPDPNLYGSSREFF